MPSRPRLMRPLRSVRHSPRLTNRNGVLTRIAPPNTAIKTPHQPSPPASISVRSRLENAQAAVEGLAGENEHEGDALQNEHRRIGKSQPPLQQSTARCDAAHEQGDRRDRDRVVTGDE